MLERLRRNKSLCVGAVVIVFLFIVVTAIVGIVGNQKESGDEDSKNSDVKVEADKNDIQNGDKESQDETEKPEFNGAGLQMTTDDGSESVIDGSGFWNSNNDGENPSGGSEEQPDNGGEDPDDSDNVSGEGTIKDDISWGMPF